MRSSVRAALHLDGRIIGFVEPGEAIVEQVAPGTRSVVLAGDGERSFEVMVSPARTSTVSWELESSRSNVLEWTMIGAGALSIAGGIASAIAAALEAGRYLRRDQIPIIHRLADHHALCERWFSSIMGGTWPNRFYSLAGQSGGVKTNDVGHDYNFATIYDRMERAGRSWKVYYSNVSFSLLFSRDYDRNNFLSIERFFEEPAAGTLPNLAIVEPIYGLDDDHPPGHPLAGQIFMASIYDALAKSPSWNRSTFIITYDEHGGFYDHVPPPKAEDERAAEGFDQLGFRVPTVVSGPWIKSGHVSSTIYDHTSFLAFVETLYGLKPLTSRDAAANDMTDLLDLERIEEGVPLAPIELPVIEVDEAVIYADECRHNLFRPTMKTGQPELELFLSSTPSKSWGDRRDQSEQSFERLLARARSRGLIR